MAKRAGAEAELMQVYQAVVPETVSERTLEAYLIKALPLLPQFVIRDAFSRRDVKMDGKRVPADAVPVSGAKILVYTAWETELPVIYEDSRILLLNKPAGISCEEDGRGGMTVQGILDARPDAPKLCHRLDNQTCGLLIAAKDPVTEACLLDAFRSRSLTKKYECLVKGIVNPRAGKLDAYIVKDERLGRMRVVSHQSPETKQISTAYETIETGKEKSRLKVTLLTGRTHQIRAHLAFIQHPILGDDVYGDRGYNQKLGIRRLMLCATDLILNAGGVLNDLDGRAFHIDCPF